MSDDLSEASWMLVREDCNCRDVCDVSTSVGTRSRSVTGEGQKRKIKDKTV